MSRADRATTNSTATAAATASTVGTATTTSGRLGQRPACRGRRQRQARGWIGADKLYGKSGADDLRGQDGNDYPSGHGGNDILRGGAGTDRSAFFERGDVDRILDFDENRDRLVIDRHPLEEADVTGVFKAARVENGHAVFRFGEGDMLVVEDVSALTDLSDSLSQV